MKRCLLTGASGYIGSNLNQFLLDHGWQCLTLGRDLGPEVQRRVLDFDPTVLVHLAGAFVPETDAEAFAQTLDANFLYGARVIELLPKSTRLVLGASYWQFASDGSEVSTTTYGALKSALYRYAQCRGRDVMGVVLYDVFGQRDPRPKLLNQFLQMAETETIQATAGLQKMDFVYISDVCRAFELAATTGFISGRYASAASGRLHTLREVAEVVSRVRRVKLNVAWGIRPYPNHQIMVPTQRIAPVAGWSASVSLEEGVRLCLKN